MTNVQVRIPDDLLEEIEHLGDSEHTSRSEIIRRLLYEGYKKEILNRAVQKYMNREVTLCRAAELTDVPVSKIASYAAEKDIPFMRYSKEEAEEDLQRLREDESSS